MHTYFLLYNITTWEYFSWEKISYVKEVPKYLPVFSFDSKWENVKFFIKKSF